MAKNNERKNTDALTRTSSYREDRKNFLTATGYTYYRLDTDSKKEIPVNIPLGDDSQNADGAAGTVGREILIVVDSIDHEEDVKQDEYDRHTDKVFSDRVGRYECANKNGEDVSNPWDEIADPKSDLFSLLYPEETPRNEKIEAIMKFMDTLTEAQRDMIYDHLGAWKTLEEIRREEENRTGKAVTQQAVSKRWNRIIAKGCKYFGVKKPCKRKK